uniref:Glutamine amidotransferase domain-containing protein n=1 Tax=Kalanchoe fedtschenkoi TaxID=63787 RepID=A0A7N0UR92_KALFE
MQVGGGEKRFALLLAARDSEYVKRVYGGYFNVFVSAFGEEGERWDLYRVVDGEFPKMDELHLYDGFVISGSPYDAYGDDEWVVELRQLIRVLDAMEKKVLGICFGHQVLCRALGGKVGRASTGWDLGLRQVNTTKDARGMLALEETVSTLAIIECHQDVVLEVPIGAHVLASSEKTGVEMFVVGKHIMGIQGHPEYTKDILFNLIDRLVGAGSVDEDLAEEAKLKLERAEPDRKQWGKICKSFLKAQVHDGMMMHSPLYRDTKMKKVTTQPLLVGV